MNNDKIELIKKAQIGDISAMGRLIKEEKAGIYAMLLYLKKDEIDINDLAQEVLLKLNSKLGQLKNPKYFKTWLNQIILNSYYDYLRKNKKRRNDIALDKVKENSLYEIVDYASNPQEYILNNELDYIIKTSINNLPMQYKIPITLREIQGLSYDQISNITNTSLGTVKSRIARARAKIKEDIEKYSEV